MPKHPLYHLRFMVVCATCAHALIAAAAAARFMGLAHGADGAEDGQADDGQYDNSTHSTSLVQLFVTDGNVLDAGFSYNGPNHGCQKDEGHAGP